MMIAVVATLAFLNVGAVLDLQKAAASAADGETVVVKDGIYDFSELVPDPKTKTYLHFRRKVLLKSESGNPDRCVFRGTGVAKPGRCLAFGVGDSRLEGITITNFYVDGCGAAVLPDIWSYSTSYTNCVFASCTATQYGGAIFRPYAPGVEVSINGCTFVDCHARFGGALSSDAPIVATSCSFVRCRATDRGGAINTSTARGCSFTDCSSGGAGDAVYKGLVTDCQFYRCGRGGHSTVSETRVIHSAFTECGTRSAHKSSIEDSVFRDTAGLEGCTLVNCGIFGGRVMPSGALLDFCVLTNCTVSGTVDGDVPDQIKKGTKVAFRSKLINCIVCGSKTAQEVVTEVKGRPDWTGVLENTLITREESALAEGRGWDPDAIKKKIEVAKIAKAKKLADENRRGVHEVFRLDFDDCAPKVNCGPAAAGFFGGGWGQSDCRFSLVEGDKGAGRVFRCDMRGVVGGELQLFSKSWVMWQNSWYRLRFRVRGHDHPGVVSVGVRKYGYPWSMLGWPFEKIHPTNEWKEYTIYKKSQHDVSGGFGIQVVLADVGTVDFDDFVVEKLDYDPTEKEAPENTNPVVYGNLIPRGGFETEGDPFFILERTSNGIWPTWNESRIERSEGGHGGRYCVHFPPLKQCPEEVYSGGGRPNSGRVFRSVDIPVATGHRYRLSGWYFLKPRPDGKPNVAHCGLEFNDVNGRWKNGDRFVVADFNRGRGKPVPGEWQRLEVVSKEPCPKGVSSVNVAIEINGYDICLDDLDFRVWDGADDDAKSLDGKPFELEAAFGGGDLNLTPKIVTWGQKLPLKVAAMPRRGLKGEGKREELKATLRVVAYPDKVTATERLTLKAGEERRIDVDPKANGILRVELEADDASLADPVESVMARLPEPRKTGPESFFGTHLRTCPYFINYAAAIGIKWQRLHDCSNMCKMKWGNPEPGKYQWADEIVDYIRAKGINILALPDYPSQFMTPTNAQGQVVYDADAYRTWCRELSRHYKGRIAHYEIWNEPWMPYFWKADHIEFGKVFNAGAEGIREGDPNAKVVGWCTEFTAPQFVKSFLKSYPVEKKPDFNSIHYYYRSVPGDGDLSYRRIVDNNLKMFGEYAGREIWNTEGNMTVSHTFYARMRRFDRIEADRGVAFGTRGWAESVAGGIAKTFLFTTHNTDNVHVGGLMTLIDYDRSPTPQAAATAVTAYFIDGLKPVHGYATHIKGVKMSPYSGDGRTSILVWDDIFERGRMKLDVGVLASGAPGGRTFRAYDAMGNEIDGVHELGSIPFFVTAKNEDVAALIAALKTAIK